MRTVIERWLLSVVRNNEPNYYSDIHIDEIDPRYTDQSQWLSGAAECLETASNVRDDVAPNCYIAVGIGLTSHKQPQGADFSSWDDLSRRMEWSPPSLYVADRNVAPWNREGECHDMNISDLPPGLAAARIRFCEWFDENDREYRRSFWLTM
jgi:hypothetical protein